MKTLILIRHAKSSWNEAGMHDYDRSLNARGLSDAPIMGARLQQRSIAHKQHVDFMISSTAQRADQTTRLLAKALNFSTDAIAWSRDLYLANPNTMLEIIRAIPCEINTLALIAHNPGISELAEKLTGEFLGNAPTCSVITIALPIDDWSDAGNWADLIDFDFPKRDT